MGGRNLAKQGNLDIVPRVSEVVCDDGEVFGRFPDRGAN